jgi:5-methyltetrahydrofolate--homocysteine methyltransferase
MLEPYGDLNREAAQQAFAEQASALAEGGVAALVCETFIDVDEALVCVAAVRSVTDLPVVASMSFEKNGRTVMGVTPEKAVVALSDAGAVVVGANCSVGPEVVEAVVRAMHAARPGTPLLAKPNAGVPELKDGRPVFPLSPGDMKEFPSRMRELGVAIVGGCCGTTPEHIAAMAGRLEEMRDEGCRNEVEIPIPREGMRDEPESL